MTWLICIQPLSIFAGIAFGKAMKTPMKPHSHCIRFRYCLCKWQDDTVEFRLPFDIFGVGGGDELKDIRVFLQDSGNEWKLMGDISANGIAIPDTAAVFEITEKLLIGDANCDKKVTVSDAVAILQFIANKDKYALSVTGKKNADCYNVGDGITANDALAVQKLDAKVISGLPAN